MKKLTFLFALLFSLMDFSFGIDLPKTLTNTVYSENIKTVECYRSGMRMTNPIINLNSDEQLVFSFDDLVYDTHDYYYTIYHCDRNWNVSKLSQHEYFDSFIDFPINDYEYSVNTTVRYINYRVTFPNEELQIKLSGNYVFVVFDKDEPEIPVITWRFYVVEPAVRVDARIRRATHDPANGENQEIDFVINHGNFPIQDPFSDIKVVVTQNNRDDNALTDLKPLYVNNGNLEYDYNFENTFAGVNEFRTFETRGIKHPGEGVAELSLYEGIYHATLIPHKIRRQQRYTFTREINGRYVVEAYNSDIPDIEADYQFVHFTLAMNAPMMGGVYVLGQLSNWQCNKSNEMQWNIETNQYELTMLLKQGYYNYMYAYKSPDEIMIHPETLEGSHYETENDYQIYVYYGRITDKYDRLIGYGKFNSAIHRSY